MSFKGTDRVVVEGTDIGSVKQLFDAAQPPVTEAEVESALAFVRSLAAAMTPREQMTELFETVSFVGEEE